MLLPLVFGPFIYSSFLLAMLLSPLKEFNNSSQTLNKGIDKILFQKNLSATTFIASL